MRRTAFVAATAAVAFTVIAASAGAQATADTTAAPWWTRVTAGADFRARIEGFTQEDSPDRLRSRLRLRVSAGAAINDDLDVGVRLVTGNPADPITANQTFTDWSVRKPITVDRAFMTYHPHSIPALRLGAGKFEAPVRITNQILDDNLSWEGAYEQLSGHVLIDAPRFHLKGRLQRADIPATAAYRRHTAQFADLSRRAPVALGFVGLLAVVAYLLNAGRRPASVFVRSSARQRPWIASVLARASVIRAPATRAGFDFTLAVLCRSSTHRLTLACCGAVGLAMSLVALSPASPVLSSAVLSAARSLSTSSLTSAGILSPFSDRNFSVLYATPSAWLRVSTASLR